MASSSRRRRRIATYVDIADKNCFLNLARQAGMTESRYLAGWIALLLEQKGASASLAPTGCPQAHQSSSLPSKKSHILSIRLRAEDLEHLQKEATRRSMSTSGLLTGILRARYRNALYFSDAEKQALFEATMAIEDVRLVLARIQQICKREPLSAVKPLNEQFVQLREALNTQHQAIQNLMAGNFKSWGRAQE